MKWDEGTSDSPSRQDMAEAQVEAAKRQLCKALIWAMPEEGLPEVLETLVEIVKFHQDCSDPVR